MDNEDRSIEMVVTLKTTISFPSHWDDDQIIEYIKQNPSEYILDAWYDGNYKIEDIDL